MKKPIPKIVDGLMRLQREYAGIHRKALTEERYKGLIESGLVTQYTLDSECIREPLIEHVGHLPIIASYLHPLIEHREQVDLGRALIMLSVHDIGETKVGDAFAYSKTEMHSQLELEAAKDLLPEYLYEYYLEVERQTSLDGKFAKAVDSLAPIMHEGSLPQVTAKRLVHLNFSADAVVAKKRSQFEWDSVMLEIFDYAVDTFLRTNSKIE